MIIILCIWVLGPYISLSESFHWQPQGRTKANRVEASYEAMTVISIMCEGQSMKGHSDEHLGTCNKGNHTVHSILVSFFPLNLCKTIRSTPNDRCDHTTTSNLKHYWAQIIYRLGLPEVLRTIKTEVWLNLRILKTELKIKDLILNQVKTKVTNPPKSHSIIYLRLFHILKDNYDLLVWII